MTNKVVAITGGGRGIGLATARALAAAGAHVAIGDLTAPDVPGLLGIELDVTDRDSFAAFLEQVEGELGPLDVLVNNAGIMPLGPFHEESPETQQRIVDVNVHGVMNGMKLALPGMLARRAGQIVNVASIAGKSPAVGGASYSMTKAAIVMLTETTRVEYAGSGIEFTCVMPSFTNTELIAGTRGTRFLKTVEPADVADAIVAAIETPRHDVFVPRMLGPIALSQVILGRRLRDLSARLLGADKTFVDIDQSARRGYEDRIADRVSAR